MKKLTPSILIRIILLFIFTGGLIYLSIKYAPAITSLVSKPDEFRVLILSYGAKSILIFMTFQILQVVIAVIPGELIQVAGGYIYGIWLGTLYSVAGILLGSIVVFFIARILGYPILKMLISPSRFKRFSFFLNSPNSGIITLILFLIPGMPKDILTYMAGITPMRPMNFLVTATLARLPGILISSYVGASFGESCYGKAAIVSGLAVMLFMLGFFFQDKIMSWFKT